MSLDTESFEFEILKNFNFEKSLSEQKKLIAAPLKKEIFSRLIKKV